MAEQILREKNDDAARIKGQMATVDRAIEQ